MEQLAQAQPILYKQLYPLTNSADGSQPVSLFLGTNGDLYGVIYGTPTGQAGEIYRMNRDGSGYTPLITVPTSTSGNSNAAVDSVSSVEGPDLSGQVPLSGGLTVTGGNDGNLYGTTYDGWTNNQGIVFSLTEDGTKFTELHNCGHGADAYPVNVIQGNDGGLYVTTWHGVIFRLASDGSSYFLFRDSVEVVARH